MTSKRSLSESKPSVLRRCTRFGVAGLSLAGTIAGTGCLDRPIGVSKPVTTNIVVTKQANNAITAIDLLLMIDNSSSMADKQATLAAAVPQLLGQLVQPNCVDDTGAYIGPSTLGSTTPCATGTPEFNPVNNIHIGIVTSSLGDHGANTICTPGALTNYTDANGNQIPQPDDVNDKGHLVGTLARATAAQTDQTSTNASLNSLGFLQWGDATLPTPGPADMTAATKIFTDLVSATHEVGCGYESQLEGWFRFLIDPVPPVLPLPAPVNNYTSRIGSDDTLLNQRAAFLRPDSLVAVVMLTDENDCSIRDTDVGWVSATSPSITTGSPACATNPNDRCCFSCTSTGPSDCQQCAKPAGPAVNDGPYQANIRCWQQKRRFGYEFLYPKSRYVVGLTKPELCPDQTFGDMDCDCTYAKSIQAGCDPGGRRMPNPLYSTIVGTLNDGKTQIQGYPKAIARSDNSAIFLAGIVGVPWQDIGTVDANGTLKYIPVTDPAWTSGPTDATDTPVNPPSSSQATTIWDMIYGDDNANITPKDIHMVESVLPRTGLPGPTAAANADPFNGHEYNTALEDLEYACIYTLPQSRACACDPTDVNGYASCKYQHPNDCCDTSFKADGAGGPGDNFDKPLCTGNTQIAAKGYPGLREIAVLKEYALSDAALTKGNSIVASICPKDLSTDTSSPGYGYNPAVAALINRLKEKLKGSCLPRPLQPDGNGVLPCRIVEALPPAGITPEGTSCTDFCNANGRDPNVAPELSSAVQTEMKKAHICDTTGGVACSAMCMCQLNQETNDQTATGNPNPNLTTCQNDPDGATTTALPPGYCYVDPDNGFGTNADLVAKCPATQRRILRFVGNNPSAGIAVPLRGSYVFTACQGSALGAIPAPSATP